MSGENERLNPAIKTTTIGVRELREISIFPLAVGEEIELSDIITDVVVKFVKELNEKGKKEVSLAQMENVEFVEFITNLIKDNLKRIIDLVTDQPSDEVLKDMTNAQFFDFAEIVYEMNFGGSIRKKGLAFVQKMMGQVAKATKKAAPKKKDKKKKN